MNKIVEHDLYVSNHINTQTLDYLYNCVVCLVNNIEIDNFLFNSAANINHKLTCYSGVNLEMKERIENENT